MILTFIFFLIPQTPKTILLFKLFIIIISSLFTIVILFDLDIIPLFYQFILTYPKSLFKVANFFN